MDIKMEKQSHDKEERLTDSDEYRKAHFIRIIEHSIERMSLKELEAVAYDLFTKGYLDDF